MHDTCIPSPSFFYFLIFGYFLQTPNNSNFFSISLEGLSDWESTVVIIYCFYSNIAYERQTKDKRSQKSKKNAMNLYCKTVNTRGIQSTELPCRHPAIMGTLIRQTAATSLAKTNYRHLTEINSRYYGLSLMRTLLRRPYSVCYKRSWLYSICNRSKVDSLSLSMSLALIIHGLGLGDKGSWESTYRCR